MNRPLPEVNFTDNQLKDMITQKQTAEKSDLTRDAYKITQKSPMAAQDICVVEIEESLFPWETAKPMYICAIKRVGTDNIVWRMQDWGNKKTGQSNLRKRLTQQLEIERMRDNA